MPRGHGGKGRAAVGLPPRLTQQDAWRKPLRAIKSPHLEPVAPTRVTLDGGSLVEIPAEAPPPTLPRGAGPPGARPPPAGIPLQGPAEDRCLLPGARAAGETERRARARRSARRWRGSRLPPGRGCERAVGRARGWKEEGGVGGLMMKKSPPSRLLN